MADTEGQAPGNVPSGRVYKANQVHKRRVGRTAAARKVGAAAAASVPTDAQDPVLANAAAPAGDDRPASAPDAPEASGPAGLGEPASTQPGDQAASQEAEFWLQEGVVVPERPSAQPEPRRQGRGLGRRIAVALVIALVIVVLACASLFAWNRWGRFDDSLDMQGDWFVEGTATPVVISDATIQLADNLEYSYQIDDHEKTIRYSFGSWEGGGRYRFSEDRQHLVIYDGEFSGAENTAEDLVQAFEDLGQAAKGQEIELPEGDGIIVLSREADPQALAARQAAERAKRAEEASDAADAQEAEGANDYAE